MISIRLSGGLSLIILIIVKLVFKVYINLVVYFKGLLLFVKLKLLSFVDIKEMVRGLEVLFGYWVVIGVKFCVEVGKILIKVKYFLFIVVLEDLLV